MEKINIYQTPKLLASAAAEYIYSKLSAAGTTFNLAMSGGSTPVLLFQTLAAGYKDKINWNLVHIFWSDERCVPPEHIDSNYGSFKKHLLDHIDIPAINIHRIEGERQPELEAERYALEMQTHVPADTNGIPAFDLILLGMGSDGHTASLFPGRQLSSVSLGFTGVAQHPVTGQKRVSLTFNILNNARECAFLITGKDKAKTLAKIFSGSKKYPAAFVQPDKLLWFIDSQSASSLPDL